MAREESDREDLLRDATALVERIELLPRSGSAAEAVVIGFRAGGALSMFFGEDTAYHFNAASEFRRAYCEGKLLKAVAGRLVSLQRVRTECEVQLVRHRLSDAEQCECLVAMNDRLSRLAQMIAADHFAIGRQVPPDADVLGRIVLSLEQHRKPKIAQRPNV
jgi:hypothetical protein